MDSSQTAARNSSPSVEQDLPQAQRFVPASRKHVGKKLETRAKPLGQLPLHREAHDAPAPEYVPARPAKPGIGRSVDAPVHLLPGVIEHNALQQ